MTRTDRIQIRYTIEFAAPFHLGTGMRAGLLDRTVVRDSDGYLYIPASTFKGVLREHCEQLCRFYLPTTAHEHAETEHVQRRDAFASPHDASADFADFAGMLTPISRIFGSRVVAGTLRFDDAEQMQSDKSLYTRAGEPGKDFKALQTSVATQVRIDRRTRTAAHEAWDV